MEEEDPFKDLDKVDKDLKDAAKQAVQELLSDDDVEAADDPMAGGMGGAFKDPKEGIGIGLKKGKDGPDKDKVQDAPGGKATIEDDDDDDDEDDDELNDKMKEKLAKKLEG